MVVLVRTLESFGRITSRKKEVEYDKEHSGSGGCGGGEQLVIVMERHHFSVVQTLEAGSACWVASHGSRERQRERWDRR